MKKKQVAPRLPVGPLLAAHPVPVLRHGGAARVLGGDGDPLVVVHLVRLGLAHLAVVRNDLHRILVGHGDLHLVGAAHHVVIKAHLLVLVQNIYLWMEAAGGYHHSFQRKHKLSFFMCNYHVIRWHILHQHIPRSWRGSLCKW